MNPKHLALRAQQCRLLASVSSCPRRQVGALILDPESNVVVSEGYNGPPRGADGHLCGGHMCHRDVLEIERGIRNDVGCHHAEENAILNASRTGSSTRGRWMLCSCDPCLMCAKMIHHAGIERLYAPLLGGAHAEGLEYLRAHYVELFQLSPITDSNEN